MRCGGGGGGARVVACSTWADNLLLQVNLVVCLSVMEMLVVCTFL